MTMRGTRQTWCCTRRSHCCSNRESSQRSGDALVLPALLLRNTRHSCELCLSGYPFTSSCRPPCTLQLLWKVATLCGVAFAAAVAAPSGAASATASDGPLPMAAPAPSLADNATAGDGNGEPPPLPPRTVRIAIVGGGISAAATATFLSLMERQLEEELAMKRSVDERHHLQQEDSSEDSEDEDTPPDDQEQDDEEQPDESEKWWMRRPIRFEIDVFEAAERLGGRMEYGNVAGRSVELGDVAANMTNFWMTVFHDMLNEFAENVGGPGWSTQGDLVDAAARADTAAVAGPSEAAAGASSQATAVVYQHATAGEEVPATRTAPHPSGEAAAPPAATAPCEEVPPVAPAEAASPAEARPGPVPLPEVSAPVASAERKSAPCEDATAGPPEEQRRQGNGFIGEAGMRKHPEQAEGQASEHSSPQEGVTAESPAAPMQSKEAAGTEEEAEQPQREQEAAANAEPAAPADASPSPPAPQPPNPYLTGWKSPFTVAPHLTEFEGTPLGPTILLHEGHRATPFGSLTLALMKSGAPTLSETLRKITHRWQNVYDFTFGGPHCAARAALSLLPSAAEYLASDPVGQHANGRPYCSVKNQAKAATRTGVGIAEALGLENYVSQLFSTLVKSHPIERSGQHLIDSLVRGSYNQTAKHVHAFAGALALAGSYAAPYDRKRFSGRVLVEFLLARTVDRSFLRCPIHKIIELEDEIIPPAEQAKAEVSSTSGSIPTHGAGIKDGVAGETGAATTTDGTPRRRRRFRLEPARRRTCTNAEARTRLANSTYDFVVVTSPLEDSPLTVYRRVRVQRATETAAALQQPEEASKHNQEQAPTVEPASQSSGSVASQQQQRSPGKDEVSGGKVDETRTVPVDGQATTENEGAHTNTASVQSPAGQQGSSEAGVAEPIGAQQSQENNNNEVRQVEEGEWTLQELHVPERPHVTAHVTCVAADGLVKYRTDEDAMYGDSRRRIRRSDHLYRPSPAAVVTSDSLASDYYSFGELFVASCRDVVESELEDAVGSTPRTGEAKSPLILFFSKKGEDQKRRRQSAAANAKAQGQIQENTPGSTKPSRSATSPSSDANEALVIKEWKVDTTLLARPSAIKLEGEQNEEEPRTEKTLYYTGKSLSPLAANGFFSRIKESTSLGRHLGQRICCATTREELDERDLSDVFKNVSHTDGRSWSFARPKLYPIVDKTKGVKIVRKVRAQTYVWGENDEDPPPTVEPDVTNFVLLENVFYTSAFENVVSCSEGAVVAAKNVANLIIKEIMEKFDD